MSVVPHSDSPFSPEPVFARLRDRLAATAVEGREAGGDHVLNPDIGAHPTHYRDAAVLIPIVAHEAATVLLTERTAHLKAHAGQIAFPGGKIDAADAGPAEAAVREAEEEVGLSPSSVSVVGLLSPYLSRTGYRIVPVIARVEPGFALTLNREEVNDAFEVPLAFLMDAANHRRGKLTWQGRERYFYEMPFEGRYIWGVTAGIIRALYEQVFA